MTELISREEKAKFLKALGEWVKSEGLYGKSPFEASLEPIKAVHTEQRDRILKMMQGPVLDAGEKLRSKGVFKKPKQG